MHNPLWLNNTHNTSADTTAANSNPRDLAAAMNKEMRDDAFVRVVMD